MTDRGRSALRQSRDELTVGPSSMTWRDNRLVIEVNEIGAPPLVSRVRGRIEVIPSAITDVELALAPDGSHVWRPFAPGCRIIVDLDAPGWQWEGHGYFDANFGTRALEQDFSRWTWGRFPVRGGTTCFYDAERCNGSTLACGVRFGADGTAEPVALPPEASLRRSLWALPRSTRADANCRPRQVLAMLDAPFYCRSAVRTRIDGEDTVGVHETLDLRRFRSAALKLLLAVRVPRRARWRFT